jgi:hypothetical protein
MSSLKSNFTVKKNEKIPEEKPQVEDVRQVKLTFFESDFPLLALTSHNHFQKR